ncbi:MAG TPA: DoxX family protein [Candidatus Cybelea sp.]|nr:DoxX family protein [Candidatus Cybelea sp.]
MTGASESSKLLFPALLPFYEGAAPYVYPMVRFFAGAMLVPHGAQKLFGWFGGAGIDKTIAIFEKLGFNSTLAWLVAIVEFFGGICIALGFLTRFWAAAAAIEFAVIAFYVLPPRGYYAMEVALIWGIVLFAISLRGGGKWSLDRGTGREL